MPVFCAGLTELNPVFAGAEALDTELVFGTPKRFPRIEQFIK